MFNELISTSLNAGDTKYIKRFPKQFLNLEEIKAIDYILDYEERYGKPPTLDFFRQNSIVHGSIINEPLEAIFDIAFKKRRDNFVLSQIRDLADKVQDGVAKPSDFEKLKKIYSASPETKLISLYEFDREELYSFNPDVIENVSFGLPALDKTIGGIFKGEVCLLVGRIASGKTTLASYFNYLWYVQGLRTLHISGEQTRKQIISKFDAMIGGFNPFIFRDKSGNEVTLKTYKDYVLRQHEVVEKKGGTILFPDGKLNLNDLERTVEENNIDVVVFDGVYLFSDSQDWKDISDMSKLIKKLAYNCNIPVLSTSQLKRTGKNGDFNTEDIAFADALGQDADTVIAVWPNKDNGTVYLNPIKNRNGSSYGITELKIDYDYMVVKEV